MTSTVPVAPTTSRVEATAGAAGVAVARVVPFSVVAVSSAVLGGGFGWAS